MLSEEQLKELVRLNDLYDQSRDNILELARKLRISCYATKEMVDAAVFIENTVYDCEQHRVWQNGVLEERGESYLCDYSNALKQDTWMLGIFYVERYLPLLAAA